MNSKFVKNLVKFILFIILNVIPSFFWITVFYIFDGNDLMRISFGLLNCLFVSIETATIPIFNVLGFCILKSNNRWSIIAILYSAIVFIVSLCWLILQFCIMINDGNDSLELIFYNGPNYNRDVYFICINNCISALIIGIIAIFERLDMKYRM